MAPKKLVFAKHGEEENQQQAPNKANEEEPSPESNEESDSDSDSKEEQGTSMVPPKKPKSGSRREPVENGSECSSPSASGFIVLPSVKPSGNKEKTPASKKKNPASKIFSDGDEITLLKGLAVFWANGRNNKWVEFYQFIKDKLTNQFSKVQVSEKIRKFRIKFETNLERARANGGSLDFSDAHESLVFELSKALWGDEKGVVKETIKMAENENEEAKEKPGKREQVDEHDEGNKITRKGKQVDEHDVEKKKKKKRKQKQVEQDDENKKISEQGKQVDEHDEENKKTRLRKEVDEHDENKKITEQGKQVDEHHEENKKTRKRKQVDQHDENKNTSEQGKQVDGHLQEKDIQGKREKVIEIGNKDFQSAFPLLYGSFDAFGFPMIAKEKCALIPRDKAQELEEKWREWSADAHRLELKKIDLIKRDLQYHLQRK